MGEDTRQVDWSHWSDEGKQSDKEDVQTRRTNAATQINGPASQRGAGGRSGVAVDGVNPLRRVRSAQHFPGERECRQGGGRQSMALVGRVVELEMWYRRSDCFLALVYCMQIAFTGVAFATNHASGRNNKRVIMLRNERLDVAHLKSRAPKYHISEQNHAELCLVHFFDSGNANHRQRFEKTIGKKLERYLPWNTFLMRLARQDIQRVETSLNDVVMWVGPYESRHKFSRGGLEESSKRCNSTCVFHALVLPEDTEKMRRSLEGELRSYNIEAAVTAVNSKKISIKVYNFENVNIMNLAESVTKRHDVLWFEAKPHITLRNKYAAITVQIWMANIRGTGQVVGCGDTGLDVDSCMFWDSSSSTGNPGPAFFPDVNPCFLR
eukprot:747964-Hanusia_phi.AAC.4